MVGGGGHGPPLCSVTFLRPGLNLYRLYKLVKDSDEPLSRGLEVLGKLNIEGISLWFVTLTRWEDLNVVLTRRW